MSTSVFVCRVVVSGETRDYATVIPPETAFATGLPADAIVGILLEPAAEGQAPSVDAFAENPAFRALLDEVVGRHAPDEPAIRDEAVRLGSGYVYVIDGRTPDPAGQVPAEDVVGAFQVREGTIVRDPYLPNPRHQLLSENGFFRLGDALHQRLLEEIARRRSDA
ncbi:MAG TPA: hypothetical protein VFR81_07480 [Longimicrobium sp.]|nr:hypothetical protein [Longimicrobium sp.]